MGGFGYFGNKGFFSLGYGINDGRYGIPFAGEFEAAEGSEEEEAAQTDLRFRRHNVPVTFGFRELSSFLDSLTVSLNYSKYQHQELEGDEVGTTFNNQQYVYRATFDQHRAGRLTGSFGFWGLRRDYETIGAESLAPPVNQDAVALFTLQEVGFERFRLQFGGRLEHNRYNPLGLDKRSFTGFSGAAGVHVPLWKGGAFVTNYTHSYRGPALEELYNNGPHIGNLTFEVGNPNLTREMADGVDFSLRHNSSSLTSAGAPSHSALRILTFGFILLSLVLLLFTHGQAGRQRTFWISALAVFAVSALHLSYHDGGYSPWWIELAGHHASLPLVLAILYQDYRFALADIFLKRALLLIALVMLASALYLTVAAPLLSRWDGRVHTEPREVALFLGLSIAVALFYPWVRGMARRFVDRTVLRRGDYRQLLGEGSQQVLAMESTEGILDATVARLRIALTAQDVRWLDTTGSFLVHPDPRGSSSVAQSLFFSQERLKAGLPESRVSRDGAFSGIDHPAAALLIPTSDSPQYLLIIGELAGGRRLLSDDMAMLESLAHIVARRIDSLRVTHERCQRDLREQEIGRLATEAELRALQAQLNPHFLFNALTTIGYLIQRAPSRAMDTLMGLTGLLRRILKRSTGELVTLGEELELIEMYLAIERARFEERLRVKIDVPFDLRTLRIPPLLLQPLVENAVKHGISPARGGGEIVVAAELERISASPGTDAVILCIRVQDTGKGASERELAEGRRRGVGLTNVKRRLERYYGPTASLRIETAPGVGFEVKARVPVTLPVEAYSPHCRPWAFADPPTPERYSRNPSWG